VWTAPGWQELSQEADNRPYLHKLRSGIDTDAPLLEASYRGVVGLGRKMAKHTVRATCGGVLVGFSVLALGFPASASSVTVSDTYYGGLNTYNNNPLTSGDVIGPSSFDIIGATLTRTNNDLQVTINTNYVTIIGDAGTGLGALFLGNGSPNYNAAASTDPHPTISAPYAYDTFAASPARFGFAFALNGGPTNPTTSSGSGTLYKLNGTGSDVVQSNVNGNYTTFPNNPASGYYFRSYQAVDVVTSGSNQAAAIATGPGYTWAVDVFANTITFDIAHAFSLGLNSSFTFAWAMTCANDVILDQVTLTPNRGESSSTPLPAAFPLFAGGLGMIALLSRKRKKQIANLAA
jgi:hypothetical protein